jgi:hypothetical protein
MTAPDCHNGLLAGLLIAAIGLGGCGSATGETDGGPPGADPPSSAAQTAANTSGQAAHADVTVDASRFLAKITRDDVGLDLGTWYDITTPGFQARLSQVHPRLVRWPGGSVADTYHWQTHTTCSGDRKVQPTYHPSARFDNFMKDVVIPGGYDVAITVNYGSNASCSGGGDPAEAVAWMEYAKRKGYERYIKYWTVGNEEFGGWEYDLHDRVHDPATYAAAMSGPNGYYALMKRADPSAQVGILAGGDDQFSAWDRGVLPNAPYDFVEVHSYPEQPGHESDTYLLDQAPGVVRDGIEYIRRELAAAGRPNTPLILGEFNSVTFNPGKQSMSIVNALFTGMDFGEALQQGLESAMWEFGAGGNQTCGNNNSADLYGWQNFGGYDSVAVNTQYAWNYCNGPMIVPEGTVLPSGNAFSLMAQFAATGQQMLAVTVDPSQPDVRAYAATRPLGGYALMLFNLSESAGHVVTVSVANTPLQSFHASLLTYDKALYDESKRNVWPGPVRLDLGRVGPQAAVLLPPWSMSVLELRPAAGPAPAPGQAKVRQESHPGRTD